MRQMRPDDDRSGNALEPSVGADERVAPKSTEVSAVQPSNALSPMLVAAGSETEDSEVQ